MATNMLNARKGLLIYVALGLLLGGTIDILNHVDIRHIFLLSSIVLFCLFYGLVYDRKNSARLVITSLGIAVLVSLPFISTNVQLWGGSTEHNLDTFLFAFPFLIYVAHAFHYACHRDNTLNISYVTLFSAVWDSFVLVIAASIFTGIATALIAIAGIIFKTVGSDLLWSIYQNFNVKMLIHTTSFFIGLYIAQQNQQAVNNLRFLLLRMMRVLFPLLALITVIYFFLYLAMLAGLFNGNSLSPIAILAGLIIPGIIFFNANFQTGEEDISSTIWTRLFFICYQVVLLCLCLRFDYLIVSAYSLDSNLGLYLLIVLFYCVSYAIGALLLPVKQRHFIKKANIGIALFFLLVLLILNNPVHPIIMTFGHQQQTIAYEPGPVIIPSVSDKKPKATITLQEKTAIDKELIESNLFWQDTISEQSFIAAERDDIPLYICRVQYNNGSQIGSFSNNTCTITYGGKALTIANYQILAGKTTIPVIWDTYPTHNSLIRLGSEVTSESVPRDLYPCRVEINGKFYIGKVVAERCNIAMDGVELGLPIQAILTRVR